MSSRSPGVSPTSISWARLGPSPMTGCVAASHRSQARQSRIALRSFVSDGRGGTGAAGRSAWGLTRVAGIIHYGPYPCDEARTHRLLGVDVRRLAWPALPRAPRQAPLARGVRVDVRHG